MQEEHGGLKGARWPGAETGRPRAGRGEGGPGRAPSTGLRAAGRSGCLYGEQRQGSGGKQAHADRGAFGNSPCSLGSGQMGRKKTADGL